MAQINLTQWWYLYVTQAIDIHIINSKLFTYQAVSNAKVNCAKSCCLNMNGWAVGLNCKLGISWNTFLGWGNDDTVKKLTLVEDNGNSVINAPNDTSYKRWSCHSGLKLLCKLCWTSSPPALGARFTVFWACRPCGPAGGLALLLTKAGDVETNPGPTTLNKKVWICDICHKQIHVRKQISIRCSRIEHWVHFRCAGIRQAQYTDTWTCHIHRESRLTPHTDITPPHRYRPWSKPPTHSPPTPLTPPQTLHHKSYIY